MAEKNKAVTPSVMEPQVEVIDDTVVAPDEVIETPEVVEAVEVVEEPVVEVPKEASKVTHVVFQFNRNVNCGGILVSAGGTAILTVDDAEEFENAKLGIAIEAAKVGD